MLYTTKDLAEIYNVKSTRIENVIKKLNVQKNGTIRKGTRIFYCFDETILTTLDNYGMTRVDTCNTEPTKH